MIFSSTPTDLASSRRVDISSADGLPISTSCMAFIINTLSLANSSALAPSGSSGTSSSSSDSSSTISSSSTRLSATTKSPSLSTVETFSIDFESAPTTSPADISTSVLAAAISISLSRDADNNSFSSSSKSKMSSSSSNESFSFASSTILFSCAIWSTRSTSYSASSSTTSIPSINESFGSSMANISAPSSRATFGIEGDESPASSVISLTTGITTPSPSPTASSITFEPSSSFDTFKLASIFSAVSFEMFKLASIFSAVSFDTFKLASISSIPSSFSRDLFSKTETGIVTFCFSASFCNSDASLLRACKESMKILSSCSVSGATASSSKSENESPLPRSNELSINATVVLGTGSLFSNIPLASQFLSPGVDAA
mmetsp:Transcript_1405/g.2042  ORF Transcript_1405/g.2042 Transcript_1405/m.2042 type:complete len:374 (-) Transcript_1405:1145-2266(-)